MDLAAGVEDGNKVTPEQIARKRQQIVRDMTCSVTSRINELSN